MHHCREYLFSIVLLFLLVKGVAIFLTNNIEDRPSYHFSLISATNSPFVCEKRRCFSEWPCFLNVESLKLSKFKCFSYPWISNSEPTRYTLPCLVGDRPSFLEYWSLAKGQDMCYVLSCYFINFQCYLFNSEYFAMELSWIWVDSWLKTGLTQPYFLSTSRWIVTWLLDIIFCVIFTCFNISFFVKLNLKFFLKLECFWINSRTVYSWKHEQLYCAKWEDVTRVIDAGNLALFMRKCYLRIFELRCI